VLNRVDDRYQARCGCMRCSPLLEGRLEDVEAILRDLDWTKNQAGAWRCPICRTRAWTEPPRAAARPPAAAKTQRKTILLVEDDYDARAIYRATLKYAGYRVIEAPTVKDARDAVRAVLPDVVILDCRLPDGDGLQLVNAWRGGKMAQVPVIVVSAHRERQDLDAALMAGADSFVPKPVPGNVLAAHVDRALRAGGPTRRVRTQSGTTPR
jgi:CheY-like chemotaxis protein